MRNQTFAKHIALSALLGSLIVLGGCASGSGSTSMGTQWHEWHEWLGQQQRRYRRHGRHRYGQ